MNGMVFYDTFLGLLSGTKKSPYCHAGHKMWQTLWGETKFLLVELLLVVVQLGVGVGARQEGAFESWTWWTYTARPGLQREDKVLYNFTPVSWSTLLKTFFSTSEKIQWGKALAEQPAWNLRRGRRKELTQQLSRVVFWSSHTLWCACPCTHTHRYVPVSLHLLL